MSKKLNIQIGDHYQGDDYLCRVTKLEGIFARPHGKTGETLIRTEITFTAIDDPYIQFVRFSSDLNQFYKVLSREQLMARLFREEEEIEKDQW
mgnify:FL=1|jgi:hypothetical protein|tara:strand:+ start:637 stop:915 length:279 start_codon:yes stop_codon:yes gene_type:complete